MKSRIINTLIKAGDFLLYLAFAFAMFIVAFVFLILFSQLVLKWPVYSFAIGFGLTFYAAKIQDATWAKEILEKYDAMVDAAMGKTKKVVKKRRSKRQAQGADGVYEGDGNGY